MLKSQPKGKDKDNDKYGHTRRVIKKPTIIPIPNIQHAHTRMVIQTGDQLWRNEEILLRIGAASNLYEFIMCYTLIVLVHALINLVH